VTPDVGTLVQPSIRSFAELVAAATSREVVKPEDSKSGASFDRLVIDGETYLVKNLSGDWIADASRDRTARAAGLWESGVYEFFDDLVDSTVVSATRLGDDPHGFPAALLMRDVSDSLVPLDAAVDLETHHAFLTTMAAMHARCWEAVPDADLMPFAVNYRMLSPAQAYREINENGDRSDVLRAVLARWDAMSSADPELMSLVTPLLDDPGPLVEAFATTPVTFLHGDWKMGNLGCHPGGRVVLLDWDRPSAGPATADLTWYLAVNSDRLPESKEATCERYRRALEDLGVATASWWPRQLSLALLGAFLQMGWSKSEQPAELAWWRDRVFDGFAQLREAA